MSTLLEAIRAKRRQVRQEQGTTPDLTFDADATIEQMEQSGVVVTSLADKLDLSTVPGFKLVDDGDRRGPRWVVTTVTDPDGEVRLKLVERAPEPGPVVSEFTTFKVGPDLLLEWTDEDGNKCTRRWR